MIPPTPAASGSLIKASENLFSQSLGTRVSSSVKAITSDLSFVFPSATAIIPRFRAFAGPILPRLGLM